MKLISGVEKVLEHDEFFANNVDTLKESVKQHRKKCLRGEISKGNNGHMKGLI